MAHICDILFCRMDTHGENDFGAPLPTLPAGVAPCKGIPRDSWSTRAVTLVNKLGVEVAKGVCHSVDADLVVDMDGKALGDDRVAVQIAQSLVEADVPSSWMWSMRSWHISRVFLNGASLYNHHQTYLFNTASRASNRRTRVGVCAYNTSRERNEATTITKREALLTNKQLLRFRL